MLGSDGAMLRGTLDVLILKALCWGPRHGYAIAEWVKTITARQRLLEHARDSPPIFPTRKRA
ncbi:MAG: hypothetical protein ABJC26_06320 [Gemmatimonadaceae bacterium]